MNLQVVVFLKHHDDYKNRGEDPSFVYALEAFENFDDAEKYVKQTKRTILLSENFSEAEVADGNLEQTWDCYNNGEFIPQKFTYEISEADVDPGK